LSLRFRSRWYWWLATALAVPLFISLGFWQWHRGEHRREVWDAFASTDLPPVEATASSLVRLPRYTRVHINAELDATRQFLLENISHAGAPGYEVLTVATLADGSRLLVNRGWLPFSGLREHLPDVAFAATGRISLIGRLGTLPVAGLASGQVAPVENAPWPRVTSFPGFEQLELAYGARLEPVVMLLDAASGPGYLRDWQAPGISPERNFGYAIQWWSFALLAICLFVGLNLKKRHV
jgi:surfeit locus 1 family protein